MNRLLPNRTEINRALTILYRPGDVVELRVPGGPRGVISGYFDDTAALTRDLLAQNGAAGIYLSLNPVIPDLLARAKNRVLRRAKTTTADRDIACRRWLLIDCDPRRPAGISATETEHQAAIERAREIRKVLTEEFGWPEPILADSGNGAHLLYRIELPNDEASSKLLEAVLRALAARFSDAAVEVDRTVFNAARIVKAYGTVAAKGENLPERPHRQAHIIEAPSDPVIVSSDLLTRLGIRNAGQTPRPRAPSAPGGFNVEDFIHRHPDLAAREPVAHEGGRKWVLATCPFNPEHRAPDAAIFETAEGRPGFKCFHNSCAEHGWKELRDLLEGPRQPRPRQTDANSQVHQTPGDHTDESRAKSLRSLAGDWRRKGLASEEIEDLLLAANRKQCVPPLAEEEVRAIAAAAADRTEPETPVAMRPIRKAIVNMDRFPVSLETLNGMAVFQDQIAFEELSRLGAMVQAITTEGIEITWPTTGDLINFTRTQSIISDATNVVLLTPPQGQIRAYWEPAAKMMLTLAADHSIVLESALKEETRELLCMMAQVTGNPVAESNTEFIECMRANLISRRNPAIEATPPPCVFVAEGAVWVHLPTLRRWLSVPSLTNHLYPITELRNGLMLLKFANCPNVTRRAENDSESVCLWRGPLEALESR